MQVMNGSSLNSDEEWKFSPDSYGDFYGGLRDVERPSNINNEVMNDHHDLPPDAFRPMEIPECTNERRSSTLSVLLERESPVALSKDITQHDEDYTPTFDSSTTTSSTVSSIEILQSHLPSALKKMPMHEHEQFAANTHWMKIVANVSSDSEDSDSDEEDNAFYNVLGISGDGERVSKALPVTCLNFDRSPTKSLSHRLKIRYGVHNYDEVNESNGNNNSEKSDHPTSGSYRAGAKVRFELERAAQKKPEFQKSFQIIECPSDSFTEGNMLLKEEENESSFHPYKKGNTAAWKEVIAYGHESSSASEPGLEMEVTMGSNNMVQQQRPQQQQHHFSHRPPPPPSQNPYGNSSFSNPSSQQQQQQQQSNLLPPSNPHRSVLTPVNDRFSQTSQSNATAPSQTSKSNASAPSQTSQSNPNDPMMERLKTITNTTWSSVTGAVSSILTLSSNNNNNNCHIKQTNASNNYYEHKGTYLGVNLHQTKEKPASAVTTSPPTPLATSPP